MPKVPAQYLEARKTEILDAARVCFLRRGFHQTTMQDICREAELSPGAVYRYFKSKEDIIRASIERNTAQWTDLISSVRSLAPNPNQAIEMVGRYFFDRFRASEFEQEARVDLECWPEFLRDEALLEAVRRQMATVREAFVEMFRQAQAEGHLGGPGGPRPEHVYNLVAAAYEGLQLNTLLEPEAVDPEGVFELLLQLLRQQPPNRAAAGTKKDG